MNAQMIISRSITFQTIQSLSLGQGRKTFRLHRANKVIHKPLNQHKTIKCKTLMIYNLKFQLIGKTNWEIHNPNSSSNSSNKNNRHKLHKLRFI